MKLRNSSFDDFAKSILSSVKEFVIFGAGMIGTVTTTEILKKYKIADRINCYVDNDKRLHNTIEPLSGKTICPVEILNRLDPDKYVLLISISRYSEIIEQLTKIDNIKNMECYVMPMMCIRNFQASDVDNTRHNTSKPVIPKIIHYMWLGKNQIPDTLQHCIDSWKRFCPDYKIVEWNEHNYDIEKNLYMKQAYASKGFGFVPDYARLDILYNHGGIYLDTDVELKKSLDGMLYQEAFCCVEKWQTINFGGGSGSVKGNAAIGKLIEGRKNISFINKDGSFNRTTCGYYDTLTLMKLGYKLDNTIQNILGMNIYTYEYFHPYDYMSGRTELTKHTYGIHHFNGGWLDIHMKAENQKTSEEFEKIYAMAEKETMI